MYASITNGSNTATQQHENEHRNRYEKNKTVRQSEKTALQLNDRNAAKQIANRRKLILS